MALRTTCSSPSHSSLVSAWDGYAWLRKVLEHFCTRHLRSQRLALPAFLQDAERFVVYARAAFLVDIVAEVEEDRASGICDHAPVVPQILQRAEIVQRLVCPSEARHVLLLVLFEPS